MPIISKFLIKGIIITKDIAIFIANPGQVAQSLRKKNLEYIIVADRINIMRKRLVSAAIDAAQREAFLHLIQRLVG